MKERKLTLILDLDNTILHSWSFQGFTHSPDYYGRIFPGKDIFQLPIDPNRKITTKTKLRPFLKQFIEMVQPLFSIYIYTMGNRKYADLIVGILNKEIPSFKMDTKRVITRDDGHQHTSGEMVKTLRQLSPTDMSFFLILDDKADVWPGAQQNLLQVYPYVYYSGRDELMLKRYPKYFKSFIEEDIDPFLPYYALYLKKLHHEYFEKYDSEGQTESLDLRTIHANSFRYLFKGLT